MYKDNTLSVSTVLSAAWNSMHSLSISAQIFIACDDEEKQLLGSGS